MVHEAPDSPADKQERQLRQYSDSVRNNWSAALDDMQAMAEDRRDRGFDTVTIPAGDTTPRAPAEADNGRWGLSYVVPNNKVEPFRDLYEGGEFSETGVYQVSENGFVYIVTECIDMDAESVIFVAGSYRMPEAPQLVRAAIDRGEMYTHLRTLDWEHLGTFQHDDASAFFPDPEQFLAYER